MQAVNEETREELQRCPADPLLTKIYVEPTTACNLNCPICMRRSWSEPGGTMEMETFNRIVAGIDSMPSVRKMSFWGIGEPLLHPHIWEMVAMAKKQRLQTELITNGLLLDQEMAERLLGASLDTLIVSIEGGVSSGSETRPREGAPELVYQNVKNLHRLRRRMAKHNPETGIEFVLTRSNLSQLSEIPRIASTLEARSIILTNLLPYTEEQMDEILYWRPVAGVYPEAGSGSIPEIRIPSMDGLEEFTKPVRELLQLARDAGFLPRRPVGSGEYCPFIGEGSMTVSWDGGVSPCIALMHSYTCFVRGRRKAIREYKLGSVRQADLAEIWNSEEYRGFRARVSQFSFSPCLTCGGCHLSGANEEDCFGNPFPVCGDCPWARGIILCP